MLVFDDPFHISVPERELEGETRWQTIGMVGGAHILLVAHTVDDEAEVNSNYLRAQGDAPGTEYL